MIVIESVISIYKRNKYSAIDNRSRNKVKKQKVYAEIVKKGGK